MAFEALNEDGDVVPVAKADPGVDYYCKECGRRMRRWSLEDIADHFKDVTNMGGGDAGGGHGCGESPTHVQWKNMAYSRLQREFKGRVKYTDKEERLDAPISGKEWRAGDVAVVFDEPDQQLGKGLIVEVQHKNHSKDITETTADYIEQDYAVAWVDGDDFGQDACRLKEQDFRRRAREAAWPEHVPRRSGDVTIMTDRSLPKVYSIGAGRKLSAQPPVPRMPPEFLDEVADRIYRSQEWFDLFDPPPEHARSLTYQSIVPATLPTEFFDKIAERIFRSQDWGDLFDPPPEHTHSLTYQSIVPATLPTEIFDNLAQHLYRRQEWAELFSAPEYTRMGLPSLYAKATGEILTGEPPTPRLPPEFVDDIAQRVKHEKSWDELFRHPEDHTTHTVEWSLEIEIPFGQWLSDEGCYQHDAFSPIPHSETTAPPKRAHTSPRTPFDDIQCHECGNYWYYTTLHSHCPNCEAAISYKWNVESGRISQSTLNEIRRKSNCRITTQEAVRRNR